MTKNEISIERLNEILYCDFETGRIFRKSNDREVGGVCPVGAGKHYRRFMIDGKPIYSHRAVWALKHGYWPNVINHKDADTLNNAIGNLEDGDTGNNMRCRSAYRNASRYGRGVRLANDKDGKPQYWISHILHSGKRHYKSFSIREGATLLQCQLHTLKTYYDLGFGNVHLQCLLDAIQKNPEYHALKERVMAE